MATIKKMLQVFSRQVKIRLMILLIAIIMGALIETAALAVISPFVSVILDSSAIESNSVLSYVYHLFSFSRRGTFLAFLAFLLAFIYLFKSLYLFVVVRIQYRFLLNRQIELADRILASILKKSYLYHVNKNLAEFHRIILADTSQFIQLSTTLLLMASDFFMCFFILAYLLTLSPSITLVVIGVALMCMLFYFKIYRGKVRETGKESREKGIAMGMAVNHALGGIKELKVFQRETFFSKQFKMAGDEFAKASKKYQIYNAIPKLLIEAICFSLAFIAMGILILSGADMENTVPLLSMFVLAAFRLLPAITRFAGYINSVTFNRPSIDSVYSNLFDEDNYSHEINNKDDAGFVSDDSHDIVVDNISFKYPGIDTAVLENVSLRIPHRKSVAFIGPTGAGKTTLVDIILGIYAPQNGYVLYNGMSIHHNFAQWAKNIGYIPQQIFLLDKSISDNVAYGIDEDKIDEKRVWESLEQAQLSDFVRSLPNGIKTITGERGARLSGGQRQRIGIARALYNNPSILVLDEATSSLDNDTERAVMDAINRFQGDKTMIIIAHRLTTVENCDIIYRIEGGKVVREK